MKTYHIIRVEDMYIDVRNDSITSAALENLLNLGVGKDTYEKLVHGNSDIKIHSYESGIEAISVKISPDSFV